MNTPTAPSVGQGSITPCTWVHQGMHRIALGMVREISHAGRGGGGGWHKASVIGSVSLWRRLLASRP